MNGEFVNKWISQVKKGTLTFIVLNILKDGKEFYGYDLITEIKKATAIEIAEGTLYPLMNRLKTDGLIDSIHTAARPRTVGGAVVSAPWNARGWGHDWRDGMRIPLEAEVAWKTERQPG